MKKIEIEETPTRFGTGYPPPFDKPCRERKRWRLGDAAGLGQFGVNLLRLPAGAWSSQRHWHSGEDEFVYVVDGEVTLVTDMGEETLRAGDSAGFKAGDADGHHLQNRSGSEAVILEIGTRNPATDRVEYPDIDVALPDRTTGYTHKDGSPYLRKAKR
ncbi:MAG: cupin domain-containing protein [Gammaproteobacteria bacterium]